MGLCKKTFWDKYCENYNEIISELYGKDLKLADDLGLWGIGSLATSLATSGYTKIVDELAKDQIGNGKIAGAMTKGNILEKTLAADKGAEIAERTASLKATSGLAGKLSLGVTVAATSYSFGARANVAVQALIRSLKE